MRKPLFILPLLAALATPGSMQAQTIIKLTEAQRQKIELTPELARELLLYTFVSVNDTAFVGLTNSYCTETDFVCGDYDDLRDDDNTCYFAPSEYSEGIKAEMGYEEKNFGKYRFVDSTGKAITPFVLGSVSDFKNGYAIVTDNMSEAEAMDIPYARLAAMGNYQIDERGRKTGNNYSLIDKRGRMSIAPKRYDVLAGYVSEGVLPACKGGKWGFVTPQGVVKIALKYQNAHRYGEGLAAVKQDGKWGFIDTKGTVVIPFQFDNAYTFRQGVAMVEKVVNGITLCGLVDHEGHSTFDYLENDSLGTVLKHHDGSYGEDGHVKYSYFERGGERVKHGYYAFRSPSLREDGHYREGKKHGIWVQEYDNFTSDENYQPFYHDNGYAPRMVVVEYDNGVAVNRFQIHEHRMIDEVYDFFKDLSGTCRNGKVVDQMTFGYNPILIDADGNITGTVQMSNYDPTGESFKEVSLEMEFVHGILVRLDEVDYYNSDNRKTIYEMKDLTAETSIGDTVIGKDRRPYKLINGQVYSLEPLTVEGAHQMFNFGAYSRFLQEDLQWLLTLPASWALKDVEGPKVNQIRRISISELMDITYAQYGNLYESRGEFESAYQKGHNSFLASVKQKQVEKKEKNYKLYGYLFCTQDEFELSYSYGEDRFSTDVSRRVRIYNNDFTPSKDWFVDFCEYLLYNGMGEELVQQELAKRKSLFESNQTSFVDTRDFITYYKKGEEALTTESTKRTALFSISKDPFNDSLLYENMATFLTYYTHGTLDMENSRRKELTKQRYQGMYGQYFLSDRDFDSQYMLGKRLFLQEAVTRQFAANIEQYKSLKLKAGRVSDKEGVVAYFNTVADCSRRSPEAYPKIVRLMLENNKAMAKEWQKNGKYFDDEIKFYEAYIAGNYKEILKGNKRK